MTLTPPTKRTTGKCYGVPTCGSDRHEPDCPAIYPLQPQPGDEPDTLTKLTRLVRINGCSAAFIEEALALISDATEARKAAIAYEAHLKSTIDGMSAKLAAQQETITALSNKATTALRMGQQQGRVELATEVLGMTDAERYLHLSMVVAEDAEH